MKKLFIGLLTFLGLSISFSGAVDRTRSLFFGGTFTLNGGNVDSSSVVDGETFCFGSQSSYLQYNVGNGYEDLPSNSFYCFDFHSSFSLLLRNNSSSSISISYVRFPTLNTNRVSFSDLLICQSDLATATGNLVSCQSDLATATGNLLSCQSDLSSCQLRANQCNVSLESCQESLQNQSCPSTGEILSGYILQSEVTSNYCQVEFGLIDPVNCPASGGTGDVNWSSFFVNNFQVQGARNIYLFMPDFLNWDYTYIDNGNTLNIEVENQGDEDYIQSVIDINSYRPTSEDFTGVFVSGLTLVMPYIVIVLFIIFVRKLIKKIFR